MGQHLTIWYLSQYQAVKAQTRMHIGAVSTEPLLLAYTKYRLWRRLRKKNEKNNSLTHYQLSYNDFFFIFHCFYFSFKDVSSSGMLKTLGWTFSNCFTLNSNVLKLRTLVACQRELEKQCRSRPDIWSGSPLFAILIIVLWEKKVFKIFENLLMYTYWHYSQWWTLT